MSPLCRVIEEGRLCGQGAAILTAPWPCQEHLCLFQSTDAVRCRGIPQRLKNCLESRFPAGYRPDLDGSFYCDAHACAYSTVSGHGDDSRVARCQGHVVPNERTSYCEVHACVRIRQSLGGRRCLRPVMPGRRHCDQCDEFYCNWKSTGARCPNHSAFGLVTCCYQHRCATQLLPECESRAVDDGQFCGLHTCHWSSEGQACFNHISVVVPPPPPIRWPLWNIIRRPFQAHTRLLRYCTAHRCRLCEGMVRNGSELQLCVAHDAIERRERVWGPAHGLPSTGLFVHIGATR